MNELTYRVKSIRRRNSIVKKDRDKKFRALKVKEREIYNKIRNLPLLPLEKPYQKGWIRFFEVREDVLKSKDGVFFQELLLKINTYIYSNNKKFTKRKKKYRKKYDADIIQNLKKVSLQEWNSEKFGLTEREKSFFTKVSIWSNCFKRYITSYQFSQSWRYVLKIKPNMITHQKANDNLLESEKDLLDNYITNHNIRPKMLKLKYGHNCSYKDEIKKNKFKPNLNILYEQYLDEKI